MRQAQKTFLGGAFVVFVLVVACGCGSSSKKTSTGDTTGNSSIAGTSGATNGKPPITVQVVTGAGSPVENFPDFPMAAQTAADAINRDGGVHGQKIDIVSCTNHGTSAGAIACAQAAVTAHATAIVPVDIFSPVTIPITSKAGIPRVATAPVTASDFSDKYTFDPVPPVVLDDVAAGYSEIKAGNKKFAYLSVLVPASSNPYAATVKADLEKLGGTVTVIWIPETATDLSPYVEQAKKFGATAILDAHGYTPRYLPVAEQLGATTNMASGCGVLDQADLSQVPASAHVTVGCDVPPVVYGDSQLVRQFKSELAQAGRPATAADERARDLDAWMAVHAIANVASTVKGTVTARTLFAALQDTTTVNIFGYSWTPSARGPSIYPNAPNGTVYTWTSNQGKYSQNGPPVNLYALLGLK